MRNPIIVALDAPSAEAALGLATELAPVCGGFKIGNELFTSAGPDIVKKIRERGSLVFLDLKYHDIPNTVAKAYRLLERDNVIETRGRYGSFVHRDGKKYSVMDRGLQATTALEEVIASLRGTGLTDSEIRIAFANVLKVQG